MKRFFNRLLHVAGCAVLTVALCNFVSCREDDKGEQQAAVLLQEARQALTDARLSEAHTLLDSLRHAYPRAVDVRREALRFEDSLNLAEARVEKAAIDSIYTFACLDREELRSTGIDTLSARFKQVRDRADSLRYAVDRAWQKVRFYERKLAEQ